VTVLVDPDISVRANTPVLELSGVTKRYGDTTAIRDVSLTVYPGEVVVLLGPSGAGKSTIFRCVSGLVRADAGHVRAFGRDLSTLSRRELNLQRRAIGLIFQQFNLTARMNALGNVLGGRLGHVATWRVVLRAFPQVDRQIALAALDRVGLIEKAYQRADSLSGGQQQRVAIARVLAQRSRLILADEPVASLDPTAAENVLSVLRAIAHESGIAVLCSLHQTDLARRFADRIVALRAGVVVMNCPAHAVQAPELDTIYRAA
jgi:phosphonate transport system ATP-binding protein